jgi:hypothetical protein
MENLLKNKNFTIIMLSGALYLILKVLIFKVPFDNESIIYYAGATLLVAWLASNMKKPMSLLMLALAGALIGAVYLAVQIYLFKLPFTNTAVMALIEQGALTALIAYFYGVKQ